MNSTQHIDSTFKKSITKYIFSRFFIVLTGYCLIVFALYLINKSFFSSFIWHGNEPLYPILKFLKNYSIETIAITFSIGFFVILIFYWNKTLGYLKIIISATENMYMEQSDLVKLPPELKEVENRMNQIKTNIIKSNYAAKEAEQRKNDLIIYLAHDLKTPLTSIIGYLTLLKDEKQISKELREKYTAISLNKAERLEDLINEFFEITRFNLSHTILDKEQVNLSRMLEQIAFEFMPMFSQKNLTYSLNADADIMQVCDIDKMQRVFDNLLRNAVNYSYEGSNITISLKQIDTSIHIKFINKGKTIPQEKLARMFEQFYRLDSSRSSKSGGAGLGLAIAKQIVELHGGTITAESIQNTITFQVTLPCA